MSVEYIGQPITRHEYVLYTSKGAYVRRINPRTEKKLHKLHWCNFMDKHVCKDPKSGWHCSLVKGHTGKHVAFCFKELCATWSNSAKLEE